LSELVAPRLKASTFAYIIIAVFAVLAGFAGIFLPISKFAVLILGLMLVAAALVKTELALALLVLVVPLASFRVNLGPVPIDAVTICTGIVIISYALNNFGKKEKRASIPFAWAFIAFLFIAVASAVVAPSTGGSIAVIVRFIAYFALVYAIGHTIKSRESLTWILVLMVSSGALTGLYGLYQYFYAPHTAKIGLYDLTGDVAARIGSTFENPNFYAEYLVLMVPLGLALVLGSRGGFRKASMGVATLFLFIGLILTYTRGSWMATGIGIVLMSLLTEAWLFWVWTALFAVALVVAPGVASRLASIADITGGTAGFRMRLWQIASGIIREHPLIGIGIGNYYDAFTEYIFRHPELNVGWVIYGAHNSYLTIWAETGIFGIASFIAIILISIKYGLYLTRAKSQDKFLSWINSAIIAGVIGFSINSLTSNSFHHPQAAVFFWFLLGLQVAIDGMKPEPAHARVSPAIEGSLALRPFRSVIASARVAIISHPTHRAISAIGQFWQQSSMVAWLYKKPALPAFAEGSRAYGPLSALFEKIRQWAGNSLSLRITGEISERAFIIAALFIAIALSARLLAGMVIG